MMMCDTKIRGQVLLWCVYAYKDCAYEFGAVHSHMKKCVWFARMVKVIVALSRRSIFGEHGLNLCATVARTYLFPYTQG